MTRGTIEITWREYHAKLGRSYTLGADRGVGDAIQDRVHSTDTTRPVLDICEACIKDRTGLSVTMVGKDDPDAFDMIHPAKIIFDNAEDAVMFKLKYL